MKRIFIVMSVLIAWTTSLTAENITRQQADEIVRSYAQSKVTNPALYANVNDPNGEGISITTSNDETFRAKYACWAYYLEENAPVQRRYLFVKEDGGSLLEVIASDDSGDIESAAAWMAMPTGLAVNESNAKLLYPNPVGDLLTIPCNGEPARVEIYDLKGTRLFSGLVSGEDACQLNVSFLSTGIYMVSVSGETYKIIKN